MFVCLCVAWVEVVVVGGAGSAVGSFCDTGGGGGGVDES